MIFKALTGLDIEGGVSARSSPLPTIAKGTSGPTLWCAGGQDCPSWRGRNLFLRLVDIDLPRRDRD